ncbi:MAG: NAD-dependent succinate-semialdehyde dehydrogenase [Acetobacteraceae bacterium]|nr:NAD-dependent succinate-semialdehyde dehydrogenase [Acetobacteraceae bacterium]
MDTVAGDLYAGMGLHIGGQWRASGGGGRRTVIDPASELSNGEIPLASAADLTAAVDAAAEAYRSWRKVGPWERSRLLHAVAARIRANADAIARMMTREVGKPLAEAKGETLSAAEYFEWYAEEAKRIYGFTVEGRTPDSRLQVAYQPVGPVAAFTPWNFPAVLPARKIAPALAAGCTVVIKPAEETPGTCMLILAALIEAGIPPGVVNLVLGEPAFVSSTLIADQRIRKISFTGSVAVGKSLMKLAADDLKRVSMELGGHAPVLVFADADPVQAAEMSARAKFRNAGQVCVSPTRFYVHEKVFDAFSEKFVAVAKSLKVGPGLEPGVEMGPLANRRRFDAAQALVADAVAKGARVLTGGAPVAGQNRGFFFQPTVLADVPDTARVMTEEPFCPIAAMTTFNDTEAVIARANGLPVGLAAYMFTRDMKTAQDVAERIETGMVGINELALGTAELPFGGVKWSGLGREGGPLGIKDYLEPHAMKFRLV